ncbi:MAG: ABC transporter permease [Gemmatimonadaceae bacterium]|nr:ABC transporter permease [Gemmatimonadaceae bacterium]
MPQQRGAQAEDGEIVGSWRVAPRVIQTELRRAIRRLARAPAFSLGVAATFALGIGANAIMFGILDRLLFRPPAHIDDPARLRQVVVDRWIPILGTRVKGAELSFPDYSDLQRAPAFAGVAALAHRRLVVGRGSQAQEVNCQLVTGNFFALLGVRPHLGRLFDEAEAKAGEAMPAVISERLWRSRYGGERSALGQTLDFGFGHFTIVGVAPRGFSGVGLETADVWLPLTSVADATESSGWATGRAWYWLEVVARLRDGISVRAAEAQATLVHRQSRSEEIAYNDYDPQARVILASLIPARSPLAPPEARVAQWIGGVSLIVLLVACSNVVNLLLARLLRRQRDMALQQALGSPGWMSWFQPLLEALVLALLGGVLAGGLLMWAGPLVSARLLPGLDWSAIAGGRRTLLFLGVLSLICGLAAGFGPAMQSRRIDIATRLKSGANTASTARSRTADMLVMLQIALSLVLVACAASFARSLREVNRLDLGVAVDSVMVVEPDFSETPPDAQRDRLLLRATERLRTVQGVVSSAVAFGAPFISASSVALRAPDVPSIPNLPTGGPYIYGVDERFFSTMGMRLVRGRNFAPTDGPQDRPVAVVNQTMARLLWPGRDPVGRCLLIGFDSKCTEVIGIVTNVRRLHLVEGETMQYYVPWRQHSLPSGSALLIVRTAERADALSGRVQHALAHIDPSVRFMRVKPMRTIVDPQARSWSIGTTVLGTFALLALTVAAIGLYSLLAFRARQRRKEFGIRAALGAGKAHLLRLSLQEGERLSALGVLVGLAVIVSAGRLLEPLLFRVSILDPAWLLVVCASLLALGTMASLLPAMRAARVELATLMKDE